MNDTLESIVREMRQRSQDEINALRGANKALGEAVDNLERLTGVRACPCCNGEGRHHLAISKPLPGWRHDPYPEELDVDCDRCAGGKIGFDADGDNLFEAEFCAADDYTGGL